MSVAELIRAIESKQRVEKIKAQERAYFDYTLADLIGKSVSRIYNSSNTIPPIYEAYPKLFDSMEFKQQEQEQRDRLSAIRFRQFVDSVNSKQNKGVADDRRTKNNNLG